MQTFERKLRSFIAQHVESAGPREVLELANSLLDQNPVFGGATVANLPASRFAVDAGVVTDHRTGLVWSQENVPSGRMSWPKAAEACKALNLGGFSDWRLPTIRELLTLVDYDRHEPAIDEAFKCESSWYWSSTPLHSSPSDYAWYVSFDNGGALWGSQSVGYFVRAVRSSQRLDLWHVR